jgi:limonene-1,2-epoxide hydrolase
MSLSDTVVEFTRTLEAIVADGKPPEDWTPLAHFVAVDRFERVGTFHEVQDWQQYTAMLDQWASSVDMFQTSVQRITEVANLVFYEIEERHHRRGGIQTVYSMTVFDFDENGKIRGLNVYLQQGREA